MIPIKLNLIKFGILKNLIELNFIREYDTIAIFAVSKFKGLIGSSFSNFLSAVDPEIFSGRGEFRKNLRVKILIFAVLLFFLNVH